VNVTSLSRGYDRERSRRLIVFARQPTPGQVKTRLARELGKEAAAGVYARLLHGYLHRLLTDGLVGVEIELSVATKDDVPFFRLAYPELSVRAQAEGDLGTRMHLAFARAFAQGCDEVVLTGSDIPDLGPEWICQAFAMLGRANAVLGPAEDGGYYLIGQRAPGADLFRGIVWSTDQVRAQTEALAHAQGLGIALLPALYDMDITADYHRWRASLFTNDALHEKPPLLVGSSNVKKGVL
jgi:uncharacterized protein